MFGEIFHHINLIFSGLNILQKEFLIQWENFVFFFLFLVAAVTEKCSTIQWILFQIGEFYNFTSVQTFNRVLLSYEASTAITKFVFKS